MITIYLQNATCRIENARRHLRAISEIISYTNQTEEFKFNKHTKDLIKIRMLIKREKDEAMLKQYRGREGQLKFLVSDAEAKCNISLLDGDVFPSGVLNMVLDYLDAQKLAWELVDERVKPKEIPPPKILTELPKLRPYQQKAVDAALESERGIIVAPTGAGKTVMFTHICAQLKTPVLIITPNKGILDNAVDTLEKYFGSQVVKVDKKTELGRINVVNIQTLVKLPPEMFESQGAVIIDEFHHSSASGYVNVNINHLKHCYYRLGCTATNFRNRGDDLPMNGVLSDVIFSMTTKEALQAGFLTPVKINWVKNVVKVKGQYQSQYKTGIVENKERNKLVAEIAKKHTDRKVLILVQQVEHGLNILSYLDNAEFVSGAEKDEDRKNILDRFRAGKIQILIGTSVLGEGVDLPNADCLILAGAGKAKSIVVQNIGRVMRLSPGKTEALVYDFTDTGVKQKGVKNYLEEHSNERAAIYNEYYN